MKKFWRLLIFLLFAGSAIAGWHFRAPLTDLYHEHFSEQQSGPDSPRPDPERYQELTAQLEKQRTSLAARYKRAKSANEISAIIEESQLLLDTTLPQLMRCWLGTPWDFNGTCSTPGSGKIACGYFVSTILQDAGFSVQRYKLAQQPSQRIIGTFLPKSKMKVSAGLNYESFIAQTKARGPGIYIVGLDSHVGFIVVPKSGEIRYLHSSGSHPYCVVDEDEPNAGSLQRSNYRVTGNITHNPDVIDGWLTQKRWPTKLKN